MLLINDHKIKQITRRMAIQIWENNWDEPSLILAGINRTGLHFANRLYDEMATVRSEGIRVASLGVNPAKPLESPITLDVSDDELHDNVIIIVDDVANTGRTIFYACKALLHTLPKKVEVAVLVNRTHKSFPIRVDYTGLSLATTLKQNIRVVMMDEEHPAVYLE